jgi:hypothetical protein
MRPASGPSPLLAWPRTPGGRLVVLLRWRLPCPGETTSRGHSRLRRFSRVLQLWRLDGMSTLSIAMLGAPGALSGWALEETSRASPAREGSALRPASTTAAGPRRGSSRSPTTRTAPGRSSRFMMGMGEVEARRKSARKTLRRALRPSSWPPMIGASVVEPGGRGWCRCSTRLGRLLVGSSLGRGG